MTASQPPRAARTFNGHTLYSFVFNDPITCIDLLGLKPVKTRVQKCNQGYKDYFHGFLVIDGKGYGFYPSGDNKCKAASCSKGMIDVDDPKDGECKDIILDDTLYDVEAFRECVRKRVMQDQDDPPYYGFTSSNCRWWRNIVIQDCKTAALLESEGLWERYGP